MTKTYRIALNAHDTDGIHRQTGQLFSHLINDFETDYHETMKPLRANVLTGNVRVLLLLERCFITEPDETFGMDLIDGEVNMDANLQMDAHSQRTTVYAIGSGLKGNEDEPLFLVRDDRLSDRVVELSHRTDNGDDDPEIETLPSDPMVETRCIASDVTVEIASCLAMTLRDTSLRGRNDRSNLPIMSINSNN